MKHSFFVLLLTLFYACTLFGQSVPSKQDIPEAIRNLIVDNEANPAIWSINVWNSEGEEVFSFQPNLLMRPASNMKLVSSAAIMDYFGAESVIKTPLYGFGQQEGSIWKGDLIIRGMGDPSMDRHFYEEDPLEVLQNWVEALKKTGIRKVEGSIIGNDAYFDQEPYPSSWEWYDLSFYYAPQISALSFNGNCVELEVRAEGRVGELPTIDWYPFRTNYISFTNLQRITPKGSEYDEYYRRLPGSNNIVLRSTLPQGYLEQEELTVDEPTLFTADTFKKLLIQEGIEVSGPIAMEHNPRNFASSQYSLIAEHQSPTMAEMLIHLNKESDNFYSEMLLKRMGADFKGEAGSTGNGVSAVRQFLAEAQIDTNLVLQYDASGLSNQNLISPRAITKLLFYMNQHPDGKAWKKGLPIAGVDGTLDYRFKNHPAYAKIQAKTGYISGARAISGYLQTSAGEELIFSMITNNFASKVRKVDEIHEQILAWLFQAY